jgi:hypothetical protein
LKMKIGSSTCWFEKMQALQLQHLIHGGSRPRRSPNLAKDQQLGHDKIYVDYFF